MEEDKRYPNSRSPSPWPSWLDDEALSGQWEGAVGGSDLSLPHTEEGTLVNVDGDWKHDMDQEPSQCGDANTWEEHGTRQELYPMVAVRVQEHPQCGASRIPGLYQGEEPVRVQELHRWEEDGVRYQEMIQWEDDGMRYKQLTQWEGGVRYRELIHLEVGVRYQEVTQWEVDGVIYQELTQCEEDGVVYHELTRWEGNGTFPEKTQWRDHTTYNIWDNALQPMNAEKLQTCPQQGPSSPSSVGTEGAAETARVLPSVAPAPLSPTDTELGAAALDGAAGKEEEPLGAEEEQAEGSPAFQGQVPPAGTVSDAPAPQSPSEGSQALLDTDQHISPEILRQALLEIQGSGQEPEDQRELEQSLAAEREAAAGAEREESPVPAPHSPCCLFSSLFTSRSSQVHRGQQMAGAARSGQAGQETKEEAFSEDENDWNFYNVLEWQYEKESRGFQQLFEWEDDIGPELSEEEVESPSVPSQWEDDNNIGRALEDWEYMTVHHIEVRPWSPEEDEWDEVSVLELSQGEGREERLRIWEAEGLCVPAPREAWAERRAPEPCPAVPGCVCPAQLAAQSPRGAAACAALEEQGAEAGTRSQGPAPQSPCCPPSPSPAQLQPQALSGQPAVPKERPSRVRRALRALRSLFRSCLAGQPQD